MSFAPGERDDGAVHERALDGVDEVGPVAGPTKNDDNGQKNVGDAPQCPREGLFCVWVEADRDVGGNERYCYRALQDQVGIRSGLISIPDEYGDEADDEGDAVGHRKPLELSAHESEGESHDAGDGARGWEDAFHPVVARGEVCSAVGGSQYGPERPSGRVGLEGRVLHLGVVAGEGYEVHQRCTDRQKDR